MSDSWAAAVERDKGVCRVAPFLPDLECSGSLDIYQPSDLEETDPPLEAAVTVCDGHLAWMKGHLPEAAALGLVH